MTTAFNDALAFRFDVQTSFQDIATTSRTAVEKTVHLMDFTAWMAKSAARDFIEKANERARVRSDPEATAPNTEHGPWCRQPMISDLGRPASTRAEFTAVEKAIYADFRAIAVPIMLAMTQYLQDGESEASSKNLDKVLQTSLLSYSFTQLEKRAAIAKAAGIAAAPCRQCKGAGSATPVDHSGLEPQTDLRREDKHA